jgi:hypothetical protein
VLAFIGVGVGGVEGAGALAGRGGAWGAVYGAGELGVDVDMDDDPAPVSSSFPSFFFLPNNVSIPMTMKKVQIEFRLVSWTSIRSTRT